jgi:hypothetical protein
MPDPIRLNAVPDSIHRSEDVEYHAPVHELRPETFVHDRARNVQIMRIQGVVPLPIGAEIELVNPNVRATVVGVRLLAGSDQVPVVVCLDVDVPESYWEER